MNIKQLIANLAKLILCGLAYFIGLVLGGMVTTLMHLPQPALPDGVDQGSVAVAMLFVSPILAFALVLIARNISGSWLARTLILSSLTYVAYTLNNVLDASLYLTAYASTSALATISPIVPSLFCGGALALFFPPKEKGQSFVVAWKEFFNQRSPWQWLWRLKLASISYMPVYLLFGLLVYPTTGEYYRQNMYGLKAAGWDQILPVLFLRSVLFLLACLPVSITWQKSVRSLLLRLGTVQFILVGFLYMLISYWLPLFVRIPHSLEILAGSFLYTGILVWLLLGRSPFLDKKRSKFLAPFALSHFGH